MIPEYVKYLFAIMPDRKNMVITMDELSELVENAEIEIAKAVTGLIFIGRISKESRLTSAQLKTRTTTADPAFN